MINAINGISLYEYYYNINQDKKKKESTIAEEMKKYGLKPTDDDSLNIAMLKRAKEVQGNLDEKNAKAQVSDEERPWAEIMYQLGLGFNEDPKDDIKDIKQTLAALMTGLDDAELQQEIQDLEDYVTNMYMSFTGNNQTADIKYNPLGNELNMLSNMNRVNL